MTVLGVAHGATYPADHQRERFDRLRVRGLKACPICGRRDWCMVNSTAVMCMRVAEGAYHTDVNKVGEPYYLHRLPDAPRPLAPALPRRDERPDWSKPSPITCQLLYTKLAERYGGRPLPPEAVEEAERRFGDHAGGALAVSNTFCIPSEADVRDWLDGLGRRADAIAAGILTEHGRLVPALQPGRKVYAYRDAHGQVRNLRGRALTPGAAKKILEVNGSREDRGALATFYQHRELAHAADGGHVRLVGGEDKADALNASGLPAVGTPGEGQLSDEMIAALVEACVGLVTIHVDGEDPKPRADGTIPTISEGQRLGLANGERLEEAGIAVRIAEPARSPGDPKLDADTLLRDGGPEAVRACDRASVPVALYRRRLGVEPTGEPAAPNGRVAELQREVRELKATERAIKDVLASRELRPGEKVTAIVLAFELAAHQNKPEHPTKEDHYKLSLPAIAELTGASVQSVGGHIETLHRAGVFEKTKTRTYDPATEQWRTQLYLRPPAERPAAILSTAAAAEPERETTPDGQKRTWGGKRTCPDCGDAGVAYRAYCLGCGRHLGRLDYEEHGAAAEAVEADEAAPLKSQDDSLGYEDHREVLESLKCQDDISDRRRVSLGVARGRAKARAPAAPTEPDADEWEEIAL